MKLVFPRVFLRRLAYLWLPAALLAAGHAVARPLCELTPPPGQVTLLDGTLDQRTPIRMALNLKSRGRVEGRYVYASSLSDIRLDGKLTAGTRLQLTEYDAGGMPRATFDGIFAARPARMAQNSGTAPAADCETLTGEWKDLRNGKASPFALDLSSIQAGPMDNLYNVAGVPDDDVVNRAASAFRRGVLENRRDVVVQSVRYPLQINVRGRRLTLNSPKALLARYNEIFTDAFVRTIGKAVPRLMFARYDGVMLGDGAVWFGADGKVIALNG